MSSTLGEWDSANAPTPDAKKEPKVIQTIYSNVDEFVREFVIHHYQRRVGPRCSFRWSARYWQNVEAMRRLDSLWRSWEVYRLDAGTGMAVWMRDFFDPHMAVLTHPEGPFSTSKDCSSPDEPLPYEPPPPAFVDSLMNLG